MRAVGPRYRIQLSRGRGLYRVINLIIFKSSCMHLSTVVVDIRALRALVGRGAEEETGNRIVHSTFLLEQVAR